MTVLVATGAALALAVAGCGGGGGPSGGLQGAQSQQVGKQDINARDVAMLRDGGDLRIPEDQLADNWNTNQADGSVRDGVDVEQALYVWPFRSAADGTPVLQTDYLQSAEVTSTDPQVITYTINPKATWDSGRPITWEDFDAQFKALNGTNTAFQVISTTGYEDIEKVERGIDDKQVVVTFTTKFGEWQSLFAPLLPKETNLDPATFNTGWVDGPKDTAGPFKVGTIDKTAQTVTLVRNEKWWGEKPKLDRIIFKVVERAALADAMANNEIDFYRIGSSVDLFQRARTIPGVTVRQAPDPTYNHITFNGAPTSILSDVALRQAIAKGIDRTAIANRLIGQIVPQVSQVGNHIYPVGSKYYRDNSAVVAYDPEAAASDLDNLGWKLDGGVRKKDGRELDLRLVQSAGNPISDAIDKTVLDQLGKIGVKVTIESVPNAVFFKEYVNVGNFDLVGFAWESTSTPLSSGKGIYQAVSPGNVGQNFGSITTPEIQQKYAAALAELDETKRAELGNEVDTLVWQQVHHIPLYAATGAVAARDTIANLGAKGFADWDWAEVGYVQP
ncbi:ABC transporter family substrate-binding protein [Pseudonocardia sp. H11422]|uniref:ABC transporter family substrate-binding protein n=1 Tax=Pseudonocardia sp. H11422 TaxID=2835866 RepID=UPI001BDC93AD|nr:ABC transporter family substrate-binding protein [Pseudonocardia sp. H11422]